MPPLLGTEVPDTLLRDYVAEIDGVRVIYYVSALGSITIVAYVPRVPDSAPELLSSGALYTLTGISGVDVATKHTNGAAPAGAAPRCRVTRPGGRLGQPTACSDPRLLAAAAFFAAAAAARFLRCSASWSW
ncbi:hypothetical protein SAMN04487980_10514 [Streptomyces sp. cf124]|nr:hypothetical protein CVT30_46400 [Streptomyces sp. AMCC400023]SFO05635.1 hypothetical protein SAMN04487980_10514 [Streptomyces sp. cf124]